jgi:hypothetical protein
MADDPKGPKKPPQEEAAQAEHLMEQLSGVLENPVMRSLMGGSTLGVKADPSGIKKEKPAPAAVGKQMGKVVQLRPARAPGADAPQPSQEIAAQSPQEQLKPMLARLEAVISQLDTMLKTLQKIRGGNPMLRRQIRDTLSQIVASLPVLVAQIQEELKNVGAPGELKALAEIVGKLQSQLQSADVGESGAPPAGKN